MTPTNYSVPRLDDIEKHADRTQERLDKLQELIDYKVTAIYARIWGNFMWLLFLMLTISGAFVELLWTMKK